MPRPTTKTKRKKPSHKPEKEKRISRSDPSGLQIAIWPAPVLKRPADPVEHVDDWLIQVIQKMKELMEQNHGVGLAAPQVGLPLRLFVASETGKAADARVFINPVLTAQSGQEEAEEGCLSLPEIRGRISRFTQLRLSALDEQGRPIMADLAGFPARIVQHENDHLDGVLIIDRMSPMARMANRKKLKELQESSGKISK
ncbi:MAG TPA: peptide deformylase [Phycisphaerae bacterium]|nr:peptide deformylase [Phycisphaerae bacterium]